MHETHGDGRRKLPLCTGLWLNCWLSVSVLPLRGVIGHENRVCTARTREGVCGIEISRSNVGATPATDTVYTVRVV